MIEEDTWSQLPASSCAHSPDMYLHITEHQQVHTYIPQMHMDTLTQTQKVSPYCQPSLECVCECASSLRMPYLPHTSLSLVWCFKILELAYSLTNQSKTLSGSEIRTGNAISRLWERAFPTGPHSVSLKQFQYWMLPGHPLVLYKC